MSAMILRMIVLLMFAGTVLPVSAQERAEKMMTSSPTAKLYRVDDGIFDLKLGDVIDLTDRKVLLSFPTTEKSNRRNVIQNSQYISVRINSRGFSFNKGQRLNLKDAFRDIFKEMDECYMDLIGLAVPKGAPAIATFRFHCE